MKKTYIEPKNTVVRINMETMIAQSPDNPTPQNLPGGSEEEVFTPKAREVIKTPDAWEEW